MGRPSLSARRAWIEIALHLPADRQIPVALRKESVDRNISLPGLTRIDTVALRKESVDRNQQDMASVTLHYASLSARRAWIEIPTQPIVLSLMLVALRKESVDRNVNPYKLTMIFGSRSPQGERG